MFSLHQLTSKMVGRKIMRLLLFMFKNSVKEYFLKHVRIGFFSGPLEHVVKGIIFLCLTV